MADAEGFIGSGIVTPQASLVKRGSDFGGSSGGTNRTYSLSGNTAGFIVVVDNSTLHKTSQYTYDGTTLTIIDPLDDTSYVDIIYFKTP